MPKITLRQHFIFISCLLALAALALLIYKQRWVNKERERLQRSLWEEQKKVDFLKREVNGFVKSDLDAAKSALLDAQSRLRGLKIEGSNATGRYISNRPASEVNQFLTMISRIAAGHGLQTVSHRGLRASNPRLQELIIREMKLTGSFGGLVQFVSELGRQSYRVFILKTEIHQPDEGPLEATVVFSL
jgi:hypothetical protein